MKKHLAFLLIAVACSAPAQIEAEPAPDRTLYREDYIQLVIAASQSGISYDGTNPQAYARTVVAAADALAVEVRRSPNWTEER